VSFGRFLYRSRGNGLMQNKRGHPAFVLVEKDYDLHHQDRSEYEEGPKVELFDTGPRAGQRFENWPLREQAPDQGGHSGRHRSLESRKQRTVVSVNGCGCLQQQSATSLRRLTQVRRPSSANTGREERLDTGIDFKVSLS
jgi:hypothetical protein